MKPTAPTAARARWTAQDLADACSHRLSTLRIFATAPDVPGCNDDDARPPPSGGLRGRYLPGPAPMALFRVHN